MTQINAKEFTALDELIAASSKIMLVFHQKPDGDAVGSALAMGAALLKKGKQVDILCSDSIPDKYHYLEGAATIGSKLRALDLIIEVDCSKTTVDKVSYNMVDSKLNLVITPYDGEYDPGDISFRHGDPNYDLVIVLDTPELALLGHVYEQHRAFFESVAIANIDHHVSNAKFGKLNLMDTASPSTGELLFRYFQSTKQDITPAMATALLTAVVTDTGSFQHSSTTASSFDISAQLMAMGGDLQKVVEYVYRRKTLPMLQLWGKILSRLQQDEEHHLVWTQVSQKDLLESGATDDEAEAALNDLIVGIPELKVAIMLYEEQSDVIRGSIRTSRAVDAAQVAALFGGGGHERAAGFRLEGITLEQAQSEVIAKVRAAIAGGKSKDPAKAIAKPMPKPMTPDEIIAKISAMMKEEDQQPKTPDDLPSDKV